jgi:hypothetical protein
MTINRLNIFKKHKGQWVAFKSDRKTVVGSGEKAITALENARKNGFDNPILFRVPNEARSYIGHV